MSRDDYEDRPRRRGYDERDDDFVPPPRKSSAGLLIGILVGVFVVVCGGGGFLVWQMLRAGKAAVVQAQAAVQQAQTRMQAEQDAVEASANMKRIGLAVMTYHELHERLPNDSYGLGPKKAGVPTPKPLLSWRVHLLPQLGHNGLYQKFKLDEPWDGPNNKPLIEEMPDVYASPVEQAAAGPGKTYYRGFCHDGAVFEKPKVPGQPHNIALHTITDGILNTVAVVEAAESIEWTRPDEWDWSPGSPRPKFGGADPNREFFLAVMAGGTVSKVRMTVSDKTLRDLIGRADGAPVNNWEYP